MARATSLRVLDQAVVFGVEDGMDRGQADVLVHAAVAGDVVRVEQFVVVEAQPGHIAGGVVGVRDKELFGRRRVAVMVANRHGEMRDVIEERVAGADRVDEADRRRRIALDQYVVGGSRQAVGPNHHHLRKAVRAGDEVAVGIGREQRNVADVGIGQLDAEEFGGMRLHDGPGCHAAGEDVVRSEVLAVAAFVRFSRSSPVATGLPAALSSYARRNT